jgi:hypothetical protein
MMRPRATLLMGTVYRGEYVVDPLAVAEAILKRSRRGWRRSRVLEPAQPGPDGAVRSHEDDAAPSPDLA